MSRRRVKEREQWDAIVLGGGAAGLAAGVYLGRYLRPTLILDEKKPRTRWHRPTAHNVLGFPAGIQRNQLLEWGRTHVAKYECVKIRQTTVVSLRERRGWFEVGDVDGGVHAGRGLIICPGIEYELPEIPGVLDYAGRSIWHCPECDGFKCTGKKIVVIGSDMGTAEMALTISIWTKQITVCTHGEKPAWGAVATRKLKALGIAVVQEKIQKIVGVADDGILQGLELENGEVLEAVGAFVNFGTTTPGELFKQLPLELVKDRWVRVDHRMRTNLRRCYAAGDVIAFGQTQLSVAMGSGATAAIWLHRELLPEGLCLTDRGWDEKKKPKSEK